MLLNIRKIQKESEELLKLRVADSQAEFIESIPTCMEEVKQKSYGISWIPMGIYDEKILVGFAMYGKSEENRIWLDRFMIGEQHQRKGYGKKALKLLIDIICSTMKCNTIFLSVHPKNMVAIQLYKRVGFNFIDELDGDAPVMQWIKND